MLAVLRIRKNPTLYLQSVALLQVFSDDVYESLSGVLLRHQCQIAERSHPVVAVWLFLLLSLFCMDVGTMFGRDGSLFLFVNLSDLQAVGMAS